MKKLNINSIGRMPFLQKDLEFMTEDITRFIEDVALELGMKTKYFIITGCQITIKGNNLSMTPGWAYYNGEILPVRGLDNVDVSSIIGEKYVKLTKVNYCNPDGARKFKKTDETEELVTDVWQDNYLNPVVSGGYLISEFAIKQNPWTLKEYIRKGVNDDSGWNVDDIVSWRKIGNIVFLSGYHFDDALVGYNDHPIAKVPSPSQECVFPGTTQGVSQIKVDRSGNVLLSGSAGARYNFSHIVYICDSKQVNSNSNTYSSFYMPDEDGDIVS